MDFLWHDLWGQLCFPALITDSTLTIITGLLKDKEAWFISICNSRTRPAAFVRVTMSRSHDVLFIAQEVLCLIQSWDSWIIFWIAAIFLALTFRCLRSDLSDILKLLSIIFDDTHWLLQMACIINHIVSEVRVEHLRTISIDCLLAQLEVSFIWLNSLRVMLLACMPRRSLITSTFTLDSSSWSLFKTVAFLWRYCAAWLGPATLC